MRFRDGFVDRQRETEIVSRNYKLFQDASREIKYRRSDWLRVIRRRQGAVGLQAVRLWSG